MGRYRVYLRACLVPDCPIGARLLRPPPSSRQGPCSLETETPRGRPGSTFLSPLSPPLARARAVAARGRKGWGARAGADRAGAGEWQGREGAPGGDASAGGSGATVGRRPSRDPAGEGRQRHSGAESRGAGPRARAGVGGRTQAPSRAEHEGRGGAWGGREGAGAPGRPKRLARTVQTYGGRRPSFSIPLD